MHPLHVVNHVTIHMWAVIQTGFLRDPNHIIYPQQTGIRNRRLSPYCLDAVLSRSAWNSLLQQVSAWCCQGNVTAFSCMDLGLFSENLTSEQPVWACTCVFMHTSTCMVFTLHLRETLSSFTVAEPLSTDVYLFAFFHFPLHQVDSVLSHCKTNAFKRNLLSAF